ncbi:L-asparaginase [Paraburkholderia sabiae]|jgi:L-asparaginase|uniref:asparaginase n=1 Tax=Paraburkholderia sabiae TaxID=273251 RepID=UPI001CAC0749|nr:asparaginase [Paraburkholderia sabiae]CAG9203643.1 L-asparaginase [Paraburkholderia sabiae]
MNTMPRLVTSSCLTVSALLIAACIALPLCSTAAQAADTATTSNSRQNLPRVIVLATGGTISGTADARSAIGYNSGERTGKQLIKDVPDIGKFATISAEQISNVGSQDMSDGIWFQLAKRIDEIFARGEAEGVVITHGTDTMEETAFFLKNVLHSRQPVVLVGSMRPGGVVGADGPNNLLEAVEVAASPQSKGRGVMVVMNDTIHDPRWITKTNTTSVQTFMSPNAGPIGYVDPASVRYVAPATEARPSGFTLPAAGQLPRVDIVYAHSNMDASQIDHAVADNAKGIIVAGVGDGDVSKAALSAMERAAKMGIVVVRASRVGTGFVNRNVEIDDDKSGFVASLDLNPQKARLLTQLLIANGVTTPAKVQDAFSTTY